MRSAVLPGLGQSAGLKIDAPEMRCRRQKFYAHPLSPFTVLSQEHHPAFLFFLGQGVDQHEHCAVFHFVPQYQQASMSVYNQRFADFAKLPPIMAPALDPQPHLVEDALAAP